MNFNLNNILQEGSKGEFTLEKFKISDKDIRALLSGIPEGNYISLKHNHEIVMSNTPMEFETNSYFIENAHGDILIAGLGIGLIVLPIQDRENVKSITIIEKNQEVIDLVASQLPLNNKIKIINADILKWEPKTSEKYDVIYIDIWNNVNATIYREEMKPLKTKFRKYLRSKKENPDSFIKCWAEYEAQSNMKLY